MSSKNYTTLAAIIAMFIAISARAQTTIVSDNYTATTAGTGFGLGAGVNTGINPPTTRITGSAAANLRYISAVTTRPDTKYDINANRLRCVTDAGIGRFTISANGATAFDFGPALGSPYATPTNPAVYDIKISMRNDATSTARFSFGIATAEGDATTWDFGIQLYRTTTTIDFYTIQKRIDSASAGVTDVNAVMGTTGPNTTNSLIPFTIRVTDAGAESSAYSSRVQVSTNAGTSWMYDTATDAALPNGFRFDGPGRVIDFDQAGNTSGNVFYDNFVITSISAPGPPASVVWTGAGGNANWSTPGNWSGGVAPVNGQPIIFDGTTGQANINDLAGFDTPIVAFNNGGFLLSGSPFSIGTTISNLSGVNIFNTDLSFSTSGAKTWSIASGSEVMLSNTTTVDMNGDHAIIGGGTLLSRGPINIGQASTANPAFSVYEGQHIIDGVAFTTRGGYRIGSQPAGVGGQTVLTNGATLTVTATSGNFRVGDSSNPNGAQLNMDNSTVSLTGNAVLAIGYAAGASGTMNQNGGLVSVPVTSFSESGAATGSYTIHNGTLTTRVIRKNNSAGSGSIYFDGAIVSPMSGASNSFMSGLNVAQIQPGGLTIDASSADVTIPQVLSGTGPFIKTNGGTVTLTSSNVYVGNTIIAGGKLVLPTLQTNGTLVQVGQNTELGIGERTLGSTLSVAAINFGLSSTLSFDLGTFPTPTAPLAKVGSLSVSGPVVINIANGLQLTPGQIVLIDYDGAINGGFQFLLSGLPPGVVATLVDNQANSSIDLNITGVPGYRWTGAVSGDWDSSSVNWINQQDNSAATYSDGFPTLFDDSAATGNINITGFPQPALITISNNTLPYVWSNGGLTVSTIKKFGSNTVTRIESGADIVGTIELNEGAFAVSNAFDTTFTTALIDVSPGNGTFVKQGLSTLTMSSSNTTYAGSVLIQEGTLKMANDRALGSTGAKKITIASGATLDLNDAVPGVEPVFVSGSGVNGVGAIIDATTGGAVDVNLRDVTLQGDTTFGAPNGGRWDIRVRSSTGPGPGLKGNRFNLTKVGSGFVSIACQRNIGANTPYWDMNLGDIVINGGTLALAESLTPGNPSKAITINSGTTLQLFDLALTNPLVRNITMSDARITGSGSATDTNILNGAISLSGADSIKMDQCYMVINGAIGGGGSLSVFANDPGRLYLNGANTFNGDLTVTNGTVGGGGSITGNLVMLGGTFAPGQLDVLGTFTVNGNATLAGTNSFELNRSAAPNSDRLNVNGTLTFGGTLKVTLGVGASSPQAGDVYHLFNKGSASAFTSISLPDLSGLPGGLSWNIDNLAGNGSISVSGTVISTPPSFTSVSVSGTNVILNGTGGTQGNNYILLTSTNIASSANWSPVATNQFGSGGNFSITNGIPPNRPASFFELQVP